MSNPIGNRHFINGYSYHAPSTKAPIGGSLHFKVLHSLGREETKVQQQRDKHLVGVRESSIPANKAQKKYEVQEHKSNDIPASRKGIHRRTNACVAPSLDKQAQEKREREEQNKIASSSTSTRPPSSKTPKLPPIGRS